MWISTVDIFFLDPTISEAHVSSGVAQKEDYSKEYGSNDKIVAFFRRRVAPNDADRIDNAHTHKEQASSKESYAPDFNWPSAGVPCLAADREIHHPSTNDHASDGSEYEPYKHQFFAAEDASVIQQHT